MLVGLEPFERAGSSREGATGAGRGAFARGALTPAPQERNARTTGSTNVRNGRCSAITIPPIRTKTSNTNTTASLPTTWRSADARLVPIRPPPRTGRNSSKPRKAMYDAIADPSRHCHPEAGGPPHST